MRITTPQKVSWLHPHRPRARKRLTIRHSPRRRTIPIHPIRPRAQNCNLLPRNLRHASQHKRRIPPPDPVTSHRTTHLSSSKNRHAPPRTFLLQNPQLRQQMLRRLLQRPTVRLGIHEARKSLRFATMMRRVHQIMLPQQNFKSRPRKRGIAILGSLAQSAPLDHPAQRPRQFCQQSMLPHDACDILHGGWVRHSRPGSQRGFMPVRHIANRKSYFHRPRRGRRQPPALGSGKMLPYYIDFFDRRTTTNQR